MKIFEQINAGIAENIQIFSTFNPDQLAGFFIGFIVASLIISSMGRASFTIMRLFRVIFRPFASLLRRARLLPRVAAQTKTVRGAALGARAAVRSAPGHMTETEWALLQPDSSVSDAEDEPEGDAVPPLYELSRERRLLKKNGWPFVSVEVDRSYIPEELRNTKFTLGLLDFYADQATIFFSRKVDLDVNEKALYEDCEGAVFVTLFRGADRRGFLALDELRRVINKNILMLIFSLWLMLALPPALFFSLAGDISSREETLPFAGLALIAGLFMFTIQNLMYANEQKQNTKTLNKFLAEYLGFLSDRFREASAEATRVIQGDKRDAESLQLIAQKWLKVLIWLPFRAFFLESFVRGVKYQIRRNAEYYLWLGYALGGGTFVYVISVANDIGDENIRFLLTGIFVMLTALYIYLLRKKVILSEIESTGWRGFDNLDVGQQMDEVIGTYAAEIAKWNGRFDRGGPKD